MAKKLDNIILAPTDFSPTCQNAINHAVRLAEKIGFNVTILHVINRESHHNMGNDDSAIIPIVEKKLAKIVRDIHTKSKVKANYLYKEGSIFEIINEVSDEIKAKLMVLGTHGRKGLQYLFGSFAMKVISDSKIPVIVVQKRGITENAYKKIVFPINLFTEVRQQVAHAIAVAKALGSKIYIFKQASNDPTAISKLNIITRQIEDEFKSNKVKFQVKEAERMRNFRGQLLDFAISEDADLILMMTDANIDHPEFNNSSWSQHIIFNKAQIPVLCINSMYLGDIYFAL
jgi:nucleotide-binding universal stress UspA family protein